MNYEKSIIGCLLLDNSCIADVYEKLRVEMFNELMCADAYRYILQSYDLGLKVDPTSLVLQLEDEVHDKSDINIFVKQCLIDVNTSAEIKSFAQVVINEYKVNKTKEIWKNASLMPRDIENTIPDIINRLTELNANTKEKAHSISEIDKRVGGNYFVEHDNGIRTGFYELDEILLGLNKGDVTVLGARPACGKSVFALNIALNVSEKGKRVAFFNLEMTDAQMYERILCHYSEIGLTRIRKAISYLNDEKPKIDRAREKITKNKNLIIYTGSFTAGEIKNKCNNQNFDLIIIDYLQLVKADRNYGNRVAEVGDISKTIKALAMELEVPVIALSQLNRQLQSTDEPSMNHLRESGDIEQDASNILFLWNVDEQGLVKGLKVDKNRQGELGKIGLKFEGQFMKFDTINQKFEQVEREWKSFKKSNNNECPFE